MATNLDEELARFQAELAAVTSSTATQASAPSSSGQQTSYQAPAYRADPAPAPRPASTAPPPPQPSSLAPPVPLPAPPITPPPASAFVHPPAGVHTEAEKAAVREALLGQSSGQAAGGDKKKGKAQRGSDRGVRRTAAGRIWYDKSLLEWDEQHYRLFVGDIGNEVTDDLLSKAFNHYTSFVKAQVVRDFKTKKSKGYGFVAFSDAVEGAKALRADNGKYIGNRPCKLTKCKAAERTMHGSGKALGTKGPFIKKKKQHVGLLYK